MSPDPYAYANPGVAQPPNALDMPHASCLGVVMKVEPSAHGLRVEGWNHANDPAAPTRFAWLVSAASLENNAWRRYDWVQAEFRNVDYRNVVALFESFAGVAIEVARDVSSTLPRNAPIPMPRSLVKRLIHLAVLTAEHHEVTKLDPATCNYIELQLLKSANATAEALMAALEIEAEQ